MLRFEVYLKPSQNVLIRRPYGSPLVGNIRLETDIPVSYPLIYRPNLREQRRVGISREIPTRHMTHLFVHFVKTGS